MLTTEEIEDNATFQQLKTAIDLQKSKGVLIYPGSTGVTRDKEGVYRLFGHAACCAIGCLLVDVQSNHPCVTDDTENILGVCRQRITGIIHGFDGASAYSKGLEEYNLGYAIGRRLNKLYVSRG